MIKQLSNEARVVETLFYIQDKESKKKVPFRLNKAQRFYDQEESKMREEQGHVRLIIAKARQKGFSSIIKGKFTVRCMGEEGTYAVVMSPEASSTQRHMDQVQYFLKHLKGPKPVFGRNSRNEIYFPKMESAYWIGTAGSKIFGRGDRITDLHCTEYAWWEDAEKHQAGAFQAVPRSGNIILESTGNGRHNDFYYVWKHADRMGYKRLFYPWFADAEYSLPCDSWKPDTPKYNGYLLEMQHKHKLSIQQMRWYEEKFRSLREDLKVMQQEYPSTPEECFQATGGALFNVEEAFSSQWGTERYEGLFVNRLKGHPKKGFSYVIGCDPSGGTGNDDMAIEVFCCETFEQVFELLNNTINPIECARLLLKIGKEFNTAYQVVEGNNHGLSVIPLLKEGYEKSRIYKHHLGTRRSSPKYGWINNNQAKHAMIGLLQENLPEVTIYGRQTVDELNSFEEVETGKFEGESDNSVIATGLAILGLKRFEYLRIRHPSPVLARSGKKKRNYMTYTLDEVLDNLSRRKRGNWRSGYGIQVSEGYA